jgi:hypothetical protein
LFALPHSKSQSTTFGREWSKKTVAGSNHLQTRGFSAVYFLWISTSGKNPVPF